VHIHDDVTLEGHLLLSGFYEPEENSGDVVSSANWGVATYLGAGARYTPIDHAWLAAGLGALEFHQPRSDTDIMPSDAWAFGMEARAGYTFGPRDGFEVSLDVLVVRASYDEEVVVDGQDMVVHRLDWVPRLTLLLGYRFD